MIIKFKHYEIEVADFVEHDDGTITKEMKKIRVEGSRITDAAVKRAIPAGCRLISAGYVSECWEIPDKAIHDFVTAYGEKKE